MQKEIKKSDLEELFSDSEKIAIKVYNLRSRTVESLIWSDVLKLKFFSINNYRIDRLVSFFSIFIAFSIFHRIFALENLEYCEDFLLVEKEKQKYMKHAYYIFLSQQVTLFRAFLLYANFRRNLNI